MNLTIIIYVLVLIVIVMLLSSSKEGLAYIPSKRPSPSPAQVRDTTRNLLPAYFRNAFRDSSKIEECKSDCEFAFETCRTKNSDKYCNSLVRNPCRLACYMQKSKLTNIPIGNIPRNPLLD